MVGRTFNALGCGYQLVQRWIGILERCHFGAHVQRIGKRTGTRVDKLRYLVDICIGHGQSAANVSDGCPGAHGAKGDDLGHVVSSVLLHNVADDLIPSVVLEVHVYVRHLFAFQVQEALKDQVVFQRVYVRDA